MKLDTIKQVRQTYAECEVNDLLDEGFKVIKILSSRDSNNDFEVCRPVYVLGKASKKKRK